MTLSYVVHSRSDTLLIPGLRLLLKETAGRL